MRVAGVRGSIYVFSNAKRRRRAFIATSYVKNHEKGKIAHIPRIVRFTFAPAGAPAPFYH